MRKTTTREPSIPPRDFFMASHGKQSSVGAGLRENSMQSAKNRHLQLARGRSVLRRRERLKTPYESALYRLVMSSTDGL